MTTVYCDSSVLLKRISPEPDSAQVRDLLDSLVDQGAHLVTSLVTRVEICRVVQRAQPSLSTQELLSIADEILGDVAIARLDDIYLDTAATLPTPGLRSLDAIHVASALITECDVVLTRDRHMARACSELGFVVA